MVIPCWSLPMIARCGWAAQRARVSRLPGVICRSGTAIAITSTGDVDRQADGEFLGPTPVTIDIRPGGATVLVPA